VLSFVKKPILSESNMPQAVSKKNVFITDDERPNTLILLAIFKGNYQ
jgi:hypothetical protein